MSGRINFGLSRVYTVNQQSKTFQSKTPGEQKEIIAHSEDRLADLRAKIRNEHPEWAEKYTETPHKAPHDSKIMYDRVDFELNGTTEEQVNFDNFVNGAARIKLYPETIYPAPEK